MEARKFSGGMEGVVVVVVAGEVSSEGGASSLASADFARHNGIPEAGAYVCE